LEFHLAQLYIFSSCCRFQVLLVDLDNSNFPSGARLVPSACIFWNFMLFLLFLFQTNEITRPLFPENLDGFSGRSYGPAGSIDEQRQVIQIDENGSSINNHSFVSRKQIHFPEPAINQGIRLLF
jgi:hypothetical protein